MSAIPKHYSAGQYLFKEGEPSFCMFLIKRGSVSVRKIRGSAFIEIAKVYPNEVIGELSFFDRRPRSAAAVALSEVDALEIRFDQLDKVYQDVPEYLRTIIASVAERLRKANDTIRKLKKDDVGPAEVPPEIDDDAISAAGHTGAKKPPKKGKKASGNAAEADSEES